MKKPNLTGKELIKWMVANKQDIIDSKKAVPKYADSLSITPAAIKDFEAAKGKYLYENDEAAGVLKRSIVANAYLYMDSHDDVHLENVFTNSIAQRAKRPAPHLYDHNFSVLAKVGKPIEYKEVQMSWRELGLGRTGKTTVLLLESEIRKDMNEQIYNLYLKEDIDQHSVFMRYIKMALAVNDEEEHPEEYKVWQEHIAKIGNRAEVENQGYFWAIAEAALLETSAVLEGSNELTPTLGNKSQPSKDIVIDEVVEEPRKALDPGSILKNYLTN